MIYKYKDKLEFLKKWLGNNIYLLILKIIFIGSKYNNIWIGFVFISIILISLLNLWSSYFLYNNIDIIINLIEESKNK